jgi:hypothetical protein
MYWIGIGIWVLNVALTAVSYVYPVPVVPWFLLFFGWTVVVHIVAGWNESELNMIRSFAPKPFRQISAVCTAYTAFNFVLCMILLREGGPGIENGQYALMNHGFVRYISREEFERLSLIESRLFTGHFLVFTANSMQVLAGRRQCKQS